MFTIDLAQELAGRNVAVNCLHPATFMDTTMVRLSGVQPISTVEEGGAAILQLAASPSLEGRSGLYFSGLRESRADPQAYDPEARAKLRALSFELVGLADPLPLRRNGCRERRDNRIRHRHPMGRLNQRPSGPSAKVASALIY